MAQIRDNATIRRISKSDTAPELPDVSRAVGAVDERGWPKTDRESMAINARLIWEEARKRIESRTHHRITLNQALAIATKKISFDVNVPLEDHLHSVGLMGEVSITSIQSELWPHLPVLGGQYHSLPDELKPAFSVRQRLGVAVRRCLLAVCLVTGNRSQPSVWWVSEECPEPLVIPPRSPGRSGSNVVADPDNQLEDEVESKEDVDPPQVPVKEESSPLLIDYDTIGPAVIEMAKRAADRDQALRDNARLLKLVEELQNELNKLSKVKDLLDLMKDEVE